jgi:hypothetical protein
MTETHILTSEYLDSGTADHVGTYRGFVHLIRWIALHLLLDVAGVIALIERNVTLGFFLIACGTVLLIWAVFTTRKAADEARTATDAISVAD